MQSEMLYRRHLQKGDIFVNADLAGATPMIVKNRAGPGVPIPPSTLSQAGNLCVATSSAWDSKAIMPAWWVHAHQVTKTATSGGGLLPVGQFEAKGEKNFLAPSQLVLGFAVMFQISKESLRNHKVQMFEDTAATEVPTEQEVAGTAGGEQAVEEKKTIDQVDTTEASAKSGEPEAQNSESDDEKDPDSVPARNPLQRGVSELTLADKPAEEGEAKDESEGEDGEQDDEQAAADEAESIASSQPQDKRELSARERRMLRQGKPIDSDPNQKGTPSPAPSSKSAASKQPPAPTRGRKAKAKKAAAKYADQDDEERELALRLLGANKAKAEKAAAAAEAKAKREKEAEAQKQRRKAQHERAAQAEQKRQALFEEGGGDDYDEETAAAERADLSWIPALVGTPHPEDEILAAIPVCAPWAALGRYKYRVKLQPGAVKKGKAVKECVGRWVSEMTVGKVKKEHAEDAGISRADAEKIRAREGELVKGWKDTEIINTVPVGKVRIMTGPSGGGGDSKAKGKGGGGGKQGAKGGKKK